MKNLRGSDHRHRLQAFSMTRNVRGSMQRSELEHVIRACGEIAGDDEFIIIGSQAILGQFPNAPLKFLM